MKRASSITITVVGFILALGVASGWASDKYPSKAIQLSCPFAEGGTSDLSARIVGNKMGEILGQPIVVMNKRGGGSSVGINFVAGSKPDGHTMLTASAGMVLIPSGDKEVSRQRVQEMVRRCEKGKYCYQITELCDPLPLRNQSVRVSGKPVHQNPRGGCICHSKT
jgi:tripartite-type tricarboxylate transporter receptor subunit TctC